MKLLRNLFLIMFLMSFSQMNVALSSDKTELKNTVFSFSSFDANFVQTVNDSNGKTLQKSEGRLSLLRPNFFKLEITDPDESLLISDGKTVYSYDPMLEQVVLYDFTTQVASSPLMLLITKDAKIWDDYSIVKNADNSYSIKSLIQNSMIVGMDIQFLDNTVKELKVLERDGKYSIYSFKEPNNEELKETNFNFTVPDGVTVDDQRSK